MIQLGFCLKKFEKNKKIFKNIKNNPSNIDNYTLDEFKVIILSKFNQIIDTSTNKLTEANNFRFIYKGLLDDEIKLIKENQEKEISKNKNQISSITKRLNINEQIINSLFEIITHMENECQILKSQQSCSSSGCLISGGSLL